ncbi:MAG: hypothetical protein V3V35_01195 [Dehalococcoidia bacterium]
MDWWEGERGDVRRYGVIGALAATALVVAACGGGGDPTATLAPTAERTVTPVPAPTSTASLVPTATAVPTPTVPAPGPTTTPPEATGRVVLARSRFTHSGFRTQVTREVDLGAEVAASASTAGGAGNRRTVTVSLRNLARPTGDVESRATINFGRQFDNFVVLPTMDGPLTLHLHRDGSLGPSPDSGGFT